MAIHIRNNRLAILDDFSADTSLPKYESQRRADAEAAKWASDAIGTSRFFNVRDAASARDIQVEISPRASLEWWSYATSLAGICSGVAMLWRRLTGNTKEALRMSELKAFDLVLSSETVATVVKTKIETYDAAIAKYRKAGQVAVAERLEAERSVRVFENSMLAEGFGKFVSEEKLVEIALKSKKGLALTLVRNFGRPIPDVVLTAKETLDMAGIFDEWVVLHYDPEGTNNLPTVKEIEKARDPILFGLLLNSRRLYYVADWKDEHCSLTLSELVQLSDTKNVVGTVEEIK